MEEATASKRFIGRWSSCKEERRYRLEMEVRKCIGVVFDQILINLDMDNARNNVQPHERYEYDFSLSLLATRS